MDIRRQLQAAAKRRKTTRLADEKAMAQRDELIREAIAQDVPRAEIARLADVTERRIYHIRRGTRV